MLMAVQEKFDNVPQASWDKLASKKIYFGHQSVGNNILAGIADIARENKNIKLRIVKLKNETELSSAFLAHSSIGKNEYPETKDQAFYETISERLSGNVDAALYKYCYVDFQNKKDTNVDMIFNKYKNNMETLKRKYPDITYMHMTTPVTVLQTGPKAWIKKIIGRPVGGKLDNKKRFEFRERLIAEYSDKDPIFDLYKYESTRPDGSRVSYELNDKTYYALAPGYTDDGAHLNSIGRKYIAQKFLMFLVENIE